MITIIFYCKPVCSMNERTEQRESIDTLQQDVDFCPLCGNEIVWDVVHAWELETEEVGRD